MYFMPSCTNCLSIFHPAPITLYISINHKNRRQAFSVCAQLNAFVCWDENVAWKTEYHYLNDNNSKKDKIKTFSLFTQKKKSEQRKQNVENALQDKCTWKFSSCTNLHGAEWTWVSEDMKINKGKEIVKLGSRSKSG